MNGCNRRDFLGAISLLCLFPLRAAASAEKKPSLEGKRILFILFDHFDESEYGIPRRTLERRGAKVTVASSSLRKLRGYQGHTVVRSDRRLRDVAMKDFDALVIPGGYRYESRNRESIRLIHEALKQGKPVAAICLAPVTLAYAGVIRGRRVTASTRFRELRAAGGILLHRPVVRDGLLITANGPRASRAFAREIVEALKR